jgi:hypothetical protein
MTTTMVGLAQLSLNAVKPLAFLIYCVKEIRGVDTMLFVPLDIKIKDRLFAPALQPLLVSILLYQMILFLAV